MNTPKSDYIDLSPLKETIAGNIPIYKKLIESFIIGIDEYVNTMNRELKTNNWPALYQIAHKIIPSIRIFNIVKLEPIVVQLETSLRDQNDLENINKNINASLNIFNKVKIELENELKLIDNGET